MKTILITDTHFGVSNNSKVWCDYQMNFIDNTLMPLIQSLKKTDEVKLVHCGDVFDSKSSLNPYIVDRVINKFEEISKVCPIYIAAGNHDFYSMTSDEICSIPLLFRGIQNISYAISGCIADSNTKELWLPYFTTEDDEIAESILKDIDFKPEVIYCHTDLEFISPKLKKLFKDINIITGHIHTPSFKNNFYTLGSAYPLTFADSNTPHGCYVMDGTDAKHMKFIENNDSIKFWRLYDDQIFDYQYDIRAFDHIEVYINKSYLLNDIYVARLNELQKQFRSLKIIPNDVKISNGTAQIDFSNYNIDNLVKDNIPENLKGKFEKILESIENI